MKAPALYLALPVQTRAIILMTMSAIAYALTFVTVRELSETFSVYMLVMLRAAIGTVILLPWLYQSGRHTANFAGKLYGFRAILVYSATSAGFTRWRK